VDGSAFGGVVAEVALCVAHDAGHRTDYYDGGIEVSVVVLGGLEEGEEGDGRKINSRNIRVERIAPLLKTLTVK